MISGPLVSIIIPVYKVEQFIKRCVVSLMKQSYQDIEYIFVDDASPDGSIAIVKDVVSCFPERIGRVFYYTHEFNRGLAAARNTGLSHVAGDYIYHCDSDDWMETDMISTLMESAVSSGSDITYCDYYLSFENNERYMHNPTFGRGEDLLNVGFLAGTTKYNVWNKLVKARLYHDSGVLFPEGHNMGEDMTMIMLTAYADKVSHVGKALYHYVKLNTNAYSNTFSEKHLSDISFNAARVISFLVEKFNGSNIDYLAFFKLNVKLPFLISDDETQYRVWEKWFPEANCFVMKNKTQPFRTRLLQWLAAHGLFAVVKLYYKIVYRFIYGVVFR